MSPEEQINVKTLKEKHGVMENLPHTSTSSLTGNFSGKPIGQEKVPTERIVATPNLKDWASEYHKDWAKGELTSVENLSVQINKEGDEFWEKTQQPVKLTKINGPKGPIYAVEDGSHRVAAAKLAGVSEIPAEVEDLTNRREFSTSDEFDQKSWWEALIHRGAIKGEIEKRGPNYHLTLKETPELPWILGGRNDFVNVNKVYRQVYGEEALAEVKSVPQEILHDRGKAEVWRNMAIREMREKEAPLAVKTGKAQGEALSRTPVKPAPPEPRREPAPVIIQGMSRPFRIGRIRSFIYQKTLHPLLGRLAKTTFGKAIKAGLQTAFKETAKKAISEGIKKGITWLATKLGTSATLAAIGSVAPGIGTAIGFVVGFVIDKAKDLLSKFKQVITKPEVAITMAIGGAVAIIAVGGTMGMIIGVPLLTLSTIGLAAGAGTFLGGFAAGIGAFFVALAAPFAVPIMALVVGLVIGLMALTLFIVFLTASAFIIPAAPTEMVSAYFRVTKTASPTRFDNSELSVEPCISYNIDIDSDQPLNISTIRDERYVNCDGPLPTVQSPIDIPPPTGSITHWHWPESGDPPYELCLNDSFSDCQICNTVTVTADIVGGPQGEKASSNTVCVNIGTPPTDCPLGWPTDQGYITQGPNTLNSFGSHEGQEAIDIGVVRGTPVKATHDGIVTRISGSGFDKRVYVRGDCNGMFRTYYIHLASVDNNLEEGKPVYRDDPIGTSGEYYNQPHLHYEFAELEMANPYIPIVNDELKGCCRPGVCTSGYTYPNCTCNSIPNECRW